MPADFPFRPESPVGGLESAALGWQMWWRFNGDSYLDLRARLGAIDRRTGDDSFELGRGARGQRRGLNADQILDRVSPALWSVIQAGGDRALMRNALLTLGRVQASWGAREGWGVEQASLALLSSTDSDSAEAMIVALGVAGGPRAIDRLLDVLLDNERGRAACKLEKVDVRRRTFAAYAAALAGAEATDEGARARIVEALARTLTEDKFASYDLQLACVIGMGIVPLAPHAEQGAFDAARQAEVLSRVASDSRQHMQLRAHALVPLARVLERMGADADEGALEILLEPLANNSRASDELQQAAAMALGIVADCDGDEFDVRARDALLRTSLRGDPMSRGLALISLARVAADPGQGERREAAFTELHKHLVAGLSRGQDDRRAWASLAIGVFGHDLAAHKRALSGDTLSALRDAFVSARSSDEASAHAIALALTRDPASGEPLLERFQRAKDSQLKSCTALALGWVGASEAVDPLSRMFLAGPKLDDQFGAAATSLRLLGGESVAPGMVEMLHAAAARKDVDAASACAALAGRVGGPVALDALVAVVSDAKQPAKVRAAALTAIGEVCDTAPHHWSSRISSDLHLTTLSSTLLSFSHNGTGLLELR